MAISIKLNKSGIKKIQNELEHSLKRQMIARGSTELRKDSEVFLKIVLEKRNETGKDTIVGSVDMFNSIPNMRMNIYNIMDDLKLHNCISTQSNICVSGEVEVILTMDGIDYFKEKDSMLEREAQKNMNNTNNFYGNVTGVQIQQGTLNSNQKQNLSKEFDYEKIFQIIRKIKKYDPMFDEEYGQLASEMRDKLSEIERLLKERENPSKIKVLLGDIKNLSLGVAGSIIASGIASLLPMV